MDFATASSRILAAATTAIESTTYDTVFAFLEVDREIVISVKRPRLFAADRTSAVLAYESTHAVLAVTRQRVWDAIVDTGLDVEGWTYKTPRELPEVDAFMKQFFIAPKYLGPGRLQGDGDQE